MNCIQPQHRMHVWQSFQQDSHLVVRLRYLRLHRLLQGVLSSLSYLCLPQPHQYLWIVLPSPTLSNRHSRNIQRIRKLRILLFYDLSFTTWLYSLRYDAEDSFLQQIKASSAKWKAHSERVASTVYNKELVYQKKEFSQLLQFCELYAEQFAPSLRTAPTFASNRRSHSKIEKKINLNRQKRRKTDHSSSASSGKSRREAQSQSVSQTEMTQEEYTVEELVNIRINDQGVKQILIKWEGYRRRTWEPYSEIEITAARDDCSIREEITRAEQRAADCTEEHTFARHG